MRHTSYQSDLILILTTVWEGLNGLESTCIKDMCLHGWHSLSRRKKRNTHECTTEERELIQEVSPPRLSRWSWWGSVWIWTAGHWDQHLQMKLSRGPQANCLVRFQVRIWVQKKQEQKKSVCLGTEYLNRSSWILGILLPEFRSSSYIAYLPWEHVHSKEWSRNFA